MSPETTLYGGFNTRRYTLVHGFCFFKLFPIGCIGLNKHILLLCRLPIEMAGGESVCAEASVTGRKKEAVKLCALNACRILDAQDILRNPMHAGILR